MSPAPDSRALDRPGAVTVDAAGTLLHPAGPIARTYVRVARAHGHAAEESEVESRLWTAMAELRAQRRGDPGWHRYWREVVRRAVGIGDERVYEDLYELFAHAEAWTVAPGADECLRALAGAGVRLGVISNWDTRLRVLLDRLGLTGLFDAVVVSGEVGFEKPDARIFALAARRLGVQPKQLLHVGDHRRADVEGARGAGCRALWLGHDVADFAALRIAVLGPGGRA